MTLYHNSYYVLDYADDICLLLLNNLLCTSLEVKHQTSAGNLRYARKKIPKIE